ncbi:hypothetical protein BGZ51_003491 [Haplosporangium sp. Z 767]|nr:hypothetical protein BGZ51_003491 [Haplosporangium sp. Z 767]KAF9185622.1 hypothetical protein BGZ50_002977 [Haplosporangium sp. Z 11]
MTCSIIKIASALLMVACAIQAAPLQKRACTSGACAQDVDSGSVSLGSSTNIVPVTTVTPITRYQPVVQSFAPFVQSECGCAQREMFGQDFQFGRPSMGMIQGSGSRAGRMANLAPFGGVRRFQKRAKIMKEETSDAQCIPSATQSCEQSLPVSTTDMGSMVTAKPSTTVLPETIYQSTVKSEAADIEAAEAQHAALSQSNVSLGSNVAIQPLTKVLPETVYQPSVENKATIVEAAEQENQSLDRSSVSLGSNVYIRPTTTVEPLTIFRPKVKSLPFVISDQGCADVYETSDRSRMTW